MKWFKLMVVAISCLIFVGSAYAAPVIKIIPENGATQVTASPGDELQFQVHLVSDGHHEMMLYAFSLWLDPNELQFVSFDYGPDPEGWTDHQYTSWTEPRNDEYTNYEPWWGSFDANHPQFHLAEFEAGDDLTLGTLTVQVLNPVADGDWDVKLKYYEPIADGFYVDLDPHNIYYTWYEQAAGTDVTPVPIPAAVWLLGSGLLGLIGIRRNVA